MFLFIKVSVSPFKYQNSPGAIWEGQIFWKSMPLDPRSEGCGCMEPPLWSPGYAPASLHCTIPTRSWGVDMAIPTYFCFGKMLLYFLKLGRLTFVGHFDEEKNRIYNDYYVECRLLVRQRYVAVLSCLWNPYTMKRVIIIVIKRLP